MTDDFVNDALDSLEKDDKLAFMFVGCHYGNPHGHTCTGGVRGMNDLLILRVRFEAAYAKLEAKINKRNP